MDRYCITEERCDAGNGVYTEYEIYDNAVGAVVGQMYSEADARTCCAALNARAKPA